MIKPKFKSPARIALNWALLFLCLQTIALIGQYFSFKADIHEAQDKVERRISLDSAFLDVGNETLNTPVNQYAIYRYLDRLNSELTKEGYPVLVSHIQEISTQSQDFTQYPDVTSTLLMNAEQHIVLEMRSKSPWSGVGFSFIALICSLLLLPVFAIATKKRKKSLLLKKNCCRQHLSSLLTSKIKHLPTVLMTRWLHYRISHYVSILL